MCLLVPSVTYNTSKYSLKFPIASTGMKITRNSDAIINMQYLFKHSMNRFVFPSAGNCDCF